LTQQEICVTNIYLNSKNRKGGMAKKDPKASQKVVCGCPTGRTPRFLEPCILVLLFRKFSHGYELIDIIKREGFLETEPDSGAVYRTLRSLEKQGFVSSKWDTREKGAAKRNYVVTSSGKKYLGDWVRAVTEKKEAIEKFLKYYGTHIANI
jgi:PadR family transcriptional regulator, regulatory protein PadR